MYIRICDTMKGLCGSIEVLQNIFFMEIVHWRFNVITKPQQRNEYCHVSELYIYKYVIKVYTLIHPII